MGIQQAPTDPSSISSVSTKDAFVESSSTSSNLFPREGASTSDLFGQEQSSTASLFPDQPSSTASLFSQEETNNTASLFQAEPSSNTAASLFTQEGTSIAAQEIVSSSEPQAPAPEVPDNSSLEMVWYQEQLVSYQQAVHEWQLWGEQHAGEVEQLKQQLQEQGMQDQVTMKQLEVQDRRET